MAPFLPIRALNRSQQVRIGGVKAKTDVTSFVDLGSVKQRRELAQHSALGAVVVVGDLQAGVNTFGVVSGCVIDEGASAADKILGISAGELRKEDGTYVTVAASTTAVTLAAAHATLGRKDIVTIDNAGTVAFTTGANGTGAAASTATQPATPAGQALLAVVARAATDDAIANAEITDARERA